MSDLTRTSASAPMRTPVMPPVELPPLPDHLAEEAAAVLGWDGMVLPPMTVLGRRVVVVAELLVDVHFDRLAAGWGPVTDKLSVATWSWPELAGRAPEPAVLISGVLAPARHWRTALTCAAPFGGIAPTAMLLPPGPARDQDCLQQADYYGSAVLASADGDLVDLVQGGRSGRLATACSTTVCRWLYEVVYDRVLACLADA